jgi:hypothetical protein
MGVDLGNRGRPAGWDSHLSHAEDHGPGQTPCPPTRVRADGAVSEARLVLLRLPPRGDLFT